MTSKERIKQAIEIANSDDFVLKESFVEWACEAMRWYSSQNDSKAFNVIEKQYRAYLKALEEKKLNESKK